MLVLSGLWLFQLINILFKQEIVVFSCFFSLKSCCLGLLSIATSRPRESQLHQTSMTMSQNLAGKA